MAYERKFKIGKPILEVNNISLAFGGVKAITDTSFNVLEHEVRAIIGPNGAGKSSMKYVLPQSTSDFIFSIIAEEYGIIVSLIILLLYVVLLFRIIITSYRSETKFGQLVSIAVGIPVVFQAFTNMAVAVQLIPVTGQPLPLVSTGGTSIWITFLAMGILLSVSKNNLKYNTVAIDD